MSQADWPDTPPDGFERFRRIRLITYVLSLIVIVSTVTLGFFQLRQDYENAVLAEQRSSGNVVRSIESHLRQVVSESRRILEGLAALYVDRLSQDRFDEGFFHGQLGATIERSGNLATLFLLDEDSFPIAGSSIFPIPKPTRQTPFSAPMTTAINEDKFQLGPLQQTTVTGNPEFVGEWFLPMVIAAKERSGEAEGTVVGIINPNVFNDFYNSIEVGESGVIQLWSANGLVIAANANSRWQTGFELEAAATRIAQNFEALGTEADGVLRYAIDPATEALFASTQTDIYGFRFTVVVSHTAEEYLSAYYDGRRRTIVGSALFFAVLGILTAFLLRQLRLTELSQRQTQQAMEEAEDANDARRQFLAQVSHEFRTPLNAIIGFSDMIKESVYGPDIGEQYVDSAKHIQMSGNHLLKIVNDIIDITKIDAGEYQIDLEIFNIEECIETAKTMLRDTAAQRSVSITTELAPGLPRLKADKRLTTQVVINLVSNAIRFAPEASEVRIAGKALADGRLEISVADRGPGIDPDIKDKIGEPFVIGGSHVYAKTQGTGLGLSICKKIIDVMGGDLTIHSEPGQGTTAAVLFSRDAIADA